MVIRKAILPHVEEMYELVNYYAEKGLMLPRSRSALCENIRDFVVIEIDGQIAGIGALHVFWNDLAELRTLAVRSGMERQGIGRQIVEFISVSYTHLTLPTIYSV